MRRGSGDVNASGTGLELEGEFRWDGRAADPAEQDVLQRALHIGVLCNKGALQPEAEERQNKAVGDPILFLNVVIDVFSALGLGAGDRGVMTRPRRDPDEPIVGRRQLWAVAEYGSLIRASMVGAWSRALAWCQC